MKIITAKKLLPILLTQAARPVIGGQAVLEGVMMRSPKSFAVAVRRPDDTIVVREEGWLSFSERLPFLKWPLLRGATMLVESMANGISALNFSAEQAMGEEEAKDGDKVSTADAAKKEFDDVEPAQKADASDDKKVSAASSAAPDAAKKEFDDVELAKEAASAEHDDEFTERSPEESKATKIALIGTMVTGMLMAIALFKFLPHASTVGLGALLGSDGQTALPMDQVPFHLVDGTIKMSIFIGYILLISLLPDVKRLFMYHGAEHMSVHTWEAEQPLDVEHTAPQSTAHPRCGTSLILMVISISVVFFAAVLPLLMPLFSMITDNDMGKATLGFVVKIPLMLPIAGIAYEVQRLAAKHPTNLLVRMFISPGMLLQKLTTRQPTEKEMEVALTALRKTVWRERWVAEQEEKGAEVIPLHKRTTADLEVFADFAEVEAKVA
ncbi:MAG: DUF1385 domain-containing protein [Deltaproteobacteria bacterium]|nr:DUF1385 domain-containing protein [Deltaproteobacteria bacterium]